jgi:hypothetical protein
MAGIVYLLRYERHQFKGNRSVLKPLRLFDSNIALHNVDYMHGVSARITLPRYPRHIVAALISFKQMIDKFSGLYDFSHDCLSMHLGDVGSE